MMADIETTDDQDGYISDTSIISDTTQGTNDIASPLFFQGLKRLIRTPDKGKQEDSSIDSAMISPIIPCQRNTSSRIQSLKKSRDAVSEGCLSDNDSVLSESILTKTETSNVPSHTRVSVASWNPTKNTQFEDNQEKTSSELDFPLSAMTSNNNCPGIIELSNDSQLKISGDMLVDEDVSEFEIPKGSEMQDKSQGESKSMDPDVNLPRPYNPTKVLEDLFDSDPGGLKVDLKVKPLGISAIVSRECNILDSDSTRPDSDLSQELHCTEGNLKGVLEDRLDGHTSDTSITANSHFKQNQSSVVPLAEELGANTSYSNASDRQQMILSDLQVRENGLNSDRLSFQYQNDQASCCKQYKDKDCESDSSPVISLSGSRISSLLGEDKMKRLLSGSQVSAVTTASSDLLLDNVDNEVKGLTVPATAFNPKNYMDNHVAINGTSQCSVQYGGESELLLSKCTTTDCNLSQTRGTICGEGHNAEPSADLPLSTHQLRDHDSRTSTVSQSNLDVPEDHRSKSGHRNDNTPEPTQSSRHVGVSKNSVLSLMAGTEAVFQSNGNEDSSLPRDIHQVISCVDTLEKGTPCQSGSDFQPEIQTSQNEGDLSTQLLDFIVEFSQVSKPSSVKSLNLTSEIDTRKESTMLDRTPDPRHFSCFDSNKEKAVSSLSSVSIEPCMIRTPGQGRESLDLKDMMQRREQGPPKTSRTTGKSEKLTWKTLQPCNDKGQGHSIPGKTIQEITKQDSQFEYGLTDAYSRNMILPQNKPKQVKMCTGMTEKNTMINLKTRYQIMTRILKQKPDYSSLMDFSTELKEIQGTISHINDKHKTGRSHMSARISQKGLSKSDKKQLKTELQELGERQKQLVEVVQKHKEVNNKVKQMIAEKEEDESMYRAGHVGGVAKECMGERSDMKHRQDRSNRSVDSGETPRESVDDRDGLKYRQDRSDKFGKAARDVMNRNTDLKSRQKKADVVKGDGLEAKLVSGEKKDVSSTEHENSNGGDLFEGKLQNNTGDKNVVKEREEAASRVEKLHLITVSPRQSEGGDGCVTEICLDDSTNFKEMTLLTSSTSSCHKNILKTGNEAHIKTVSGKEIKDTSLSGQSDIQRKLSEPEVEKISSNIAYKTSKENLFMDALNLETSQNVSKVTVDVVAFQRNLIEDSQQDLFSQESSRSEYDIDRKVLDDVIRTQTQTSETEDNVDEDIVEIFTDSSGHQKGLNLDVTKNRETADELKNPPNGKNSLYQIGSVQRNISKRKSIDDESEIGMKKIRVDGNVKVLVDNPTGTLQNRGTSFQIENPVKTPDPLVDTHTQQSSGTPADVIVHSQDTTPSQLSNNSDKLVSTLHKEPSKQPSQIQTKSASNKKKGFVTPPVSYPQEETTLGMATLQEPSVDSNKTEKLIQKMKTMVNCESKMSTIPKEQTSVVPANKRETINFQHYQEETTLDMEKYQPEPQSTVILLSPDVQKSVPNATNQLMSPPMPPCDGREALVSPPERILPLHTMLSPCSTAASSDVFPVSYRELARRIEQRNAREKMATKMKNRDKPASDNDYIAIPICRVEDFDHGKTTLEDFRGLVSKTVGVQPKPTFVQPPAPPVVKPASSSKVTGLTTLVEAGVITPGRDVMSLETKDKIFRASLNDKGHIIGSGGEMFRTPTSWFQAITGARTVKKFQTYSRVLYKGKSLSAFDLAINSKQTTSLPYKTTHTGMTTVHPYRSTSTSRIITDLGGANASKETQVQGAPRGPSFSRGGEPVMSGRGRGRGRAPISDLMKILSRCTIKLIDDSEIVPCPEIDSKFWMSDFKDIRMSESLWDSVDSWNE